MRGFRKALGLTQAEVGLQIGLSRVMIGLMERGERKISSRTQHALASIKPRPLQQNTSTYAPLTVRLEKTLIEGGMRYDADRIIDGHMVDFYLIDLDIALFVETTRGNGGRNVPPNTDTISIVGKYALDAFITLIEHGGVHARLNAKRDPYAERINRLP